MKIVKLELKNFRLFDNKIIDIKNKITYFSGVNGLGKTSLLEAIYLALTTRSFRTNDYRSVIKKDKMFAQINLVLSTDDNIKLVLTNKSQSLYLNNDLVKKNSSYIGLFPVISFSKKDYETFFISPSFRRGYFDFEISKFSNNYLQTLIEFNKLLKKRNELLKDFTNDKLQLFNTINKYLLEKASIIIIQRDNYITKLNNLINKYFNLWNLPLVKINYLFNVSTKDLEIKLNDISNDLKYKQTMFGPQKDDYEITFNNFNILTYQSSGEQKITLFGIKLVIAKLIEEIIKKIPIILIDDIYSELDNQNVFKIKTIIDNLNNQVFISTIINFNE